MSSTIRSLETPPKLGQEHPGGGGGKGKGLDEKQKTEESSQAPPQQHHNLFCTYPDGEISLIPQLLTLMAIVATIMAFPIFAWGDRNFMCIEVLSNGITLSDCAPLKLTSPSYWQDLNEGAEGWAGAIQAAAIFGIFAAAMGFMSFALLATALCFPLTPRRLLSVLIMQGVCALFTILTLVAGAADVCKLLGLDTGSCETDKAHVDTGGAFMIFAFFLYIAAAITTLFYYLKIRSEARGKDETMRLTMAAAPITSSAAAGGRPSMSVTKTISPSGVTRTEREYVDERGLLVKEVTIEEVADPPVPDEIKM